MALNAIVESLDDVEETLRGLYKEVKLKDKDGKDTKDAFVLDVENLDGHPSVFALRESRRKDRDQITALTKENKELKAHAEAMPEDFEAEEWNRLKALKEELDKGGGEVDPDKKKRHEAEIQSQKKMHEQQLAKIEKKMVDGFKERDDKYSTLEKDFHTTLIDGITGELAKAGVQPHFLKAAKAVLAPSVKIVHEDDRYIPKVETDMGDVPFQEFVPQWVQSDDGKHFVEPAKGGGASGGDKQQRASNEHNPFMHGHWNLTEQAQIWKQDAARAERLAIAAGHKKALGAKREGAKDFTTVK